MRAHALRGKSAFQFFYHLFHHIGLVKLALAALIITLCDVGICSQPFILARIIRHQTVNYSRPFIFGECHSV